eukprot:5124949-Amphidinium_carterae.1
MINNNNDNDKQQNNTKSTNDGKYCGKRSCNRACYVQFKPLTTDHNPCGSSESSRKWLATSTSHHNPTSNNTTMGHIQLRQ